MLYPLTFEPIFKERVWGGRNLERLYQKRLPADVPIGESWEISDRGPDVSVISNGSFKGRNLRWLVENHPADLLGDIPSPEGRFPLLIKILDARDRLSLQVHPPAAKAAQLGGEPKTEMWYIAEAQPGADLYAGLKAGVTRQMFESRIKDGTVAQCIHHIPVNPGDALFLPSGRVHAIGAGNVIFEIQQNSDTTYRVFDWNRVGLDGKPRELHVRESLESINFEDFEPALEPAEFSETAGSRKRVLVRDDLFCVNYLELGDGATMRAPDQRMQIIGLLKGTLQVEHSSGIAELEAGRFCLIPASLSAVKFVARSQSAFLLVTGGQQ